jgi:hypothetical protein
MAVLMAAIGHGVGMIRVRCPDQMPAHMGGMPGYTSSQPDDAPAGANHRHGDHSASQHRNDRAEGHGPCTCPVTGACAGIAAAVPTADPRVDRTPEAASVAPPVDLVITSIPRAPREVGTHPPSTAPPAAL